MTRNHKHNLSVQIYIVVFFFSPLPPSLPIPATEVTTRLHIQKECSVFEMIEIMFSYPFPQQIQFYSVIKGKKK